MNKKYNELRTYIQLTRDLLWKYVDHKMPLEPWDQATEITFQGESRFDEIHQNVHNHIEYHDG